jgi:solute carrier family 50 (sugar transporter)
MTFSDVIWLFATIASISLALSPIPAMRDIIANKSIREYSVFPYAVTVAQCTLWVFYGLGLGKDGKMMIITNAILIPIELAYCLLFLKYSKDEREKLKNIVKVLLGLSALVVSVVVLNWLFTYKSTNILFISVITLNICMFGGPLSNLFTVIKKKDSSSMPFLLSVATFACGCLWFLWGILQGKVAVYVPNGIGIGLGLVQLYVIKKYSKEREEVQSDHQEQRQQQQGADEDLKKEKNDIII